MNTESGRRRRRRRRGKSQVGHRQSVGECAQAKKGEREREKWIKRGFTKEGLRRGKRGGSLGEKAQGAPTPIQNNNQNQIR